MIATGEQRPVFTGLDRDAQADFIWQGSYYPQYGWFPDSRHVAIWGRGRLWKVDMDSGTATEIPFRVHAKHRITTPPRFTQRSRAGAIHGPGDPAAGLCTGWPQRRFQRARSPVAQGIARRRARTDDKRSRARIRAGVLT